MCKIKILYLLLCCYYEISGQMNALVDGIASGIDPVVANKSVSINVTPNAIRVDGDFNSYP